MTCRDEVLAAATVIVRRTGKNEFSPQEVIDALVESGSGATRRPPFGLTLSLDAA